MIFEAMEVTPVVLIKGPAKCLGTHEAGVPSPFINLP